MQTFAVAGTLGIFSSSLFVAEAAVFFFRIRHVKNPRNAQSVDVRILVTHRSEMGSDAQAIIDAVNANTDSKLASLRKNVQGFGVEVKALKAGVMRTNSRMDENNKRREILEQEMCELEDELKLRSQDEEVKGLEDTLN